MNINLTLVLQMVVFAVFVWFTMRFVWPPLVKAMDERQAKIADGLAAAERARKELELTQARIVGDLKQAKRDAADLLEKANQRASQLIDQAKEEARLEAQRLVKVAQEQIVIEISRAKDSLLQQVAALAVSGAEKILMREINEETNHTLVNNLIEEL